MSLTAKEAFNKLPIKLQKFFTKYPPAPFKQYATAPTSTLAEDANPFLFNVHPITKKVHNPVYSMRKQSDLYKLLYKFGVSDLLPVLNNGKKFFQDKFDNSIPLRGVTNPKGHKWERTMDLRKKRIEDGLAQADDLLIEARGMKYKRRLERKLLEKRRWY